jgi:heme/copper-type cytochrome/quinol oxidase subunit 2
MSVLHLFACLTCLPDPNTPQADAQGFAILVMLGILSFVFGVLFYTIVSFARKQRMYAAALEAAG